MSLYVDEDLPNIPSSSTAPSIVQDPVQALHQALTLPAESTEQSKALQTASERFEANPKRLPELCAQLLPMVVDGGETLLRRWTLEMVGFAVGRGELGEEVKVEGKYLLEKRREGLIWSSCADFTGGIGQAANGE
jgi:symplekin